MNRTAILLAILLLAAFAPVTAQQATEQPTNSHWWNDRVFYEMFVRSFYDSNGDGIGDLQGAIQKLDYLNDGDPNTTTDLGVTGIYLMPIMSAASYHGYDTTDYLSVDPAYGTNDDFKQLIAAAHQRGISVIVDLVLNHTSNQHPWFQASAAGNPNYADWYRWDDSCPTYPGPWGEKVWIALGDRCYYAVFYYQQPDLNYENPAVTTEMYDVARYWLQDMGADGFRLDALQHLIEDGQNQVNTDATHQWADGFHQYIQSVNPDSLVVGEVDASSFISSSYVPDAADLVFEFDFANAMLQSAQQGRSSNITGLQNRVDQLYPPGQYAAFLTNHDQNRVMNALVGDVDKAKAAADLLLTQPGVPFIYYGEEIGMSGAKPDERIRTPMQWDSTGGFTTGTAWEPLQDDLSSVNVAAETDDPNSLLSHYRDLIHLRDENPALLHGDLIPVKSASHSVYSFIRQSDDQTLLVVINLSNADVSDYGLSLDSGLSAGAQAAPIYGADSVTQPEIDANGGFSGYLPLSNLSPYTITVIRLGA